MTDASIERIRRIVVISIKAIVIGIFALIVGGVFSALPPPASLAVTNILHGAGTLAERRYYFMSLFLVPIEEFAVAEADGLARVRNARTALAIERFRLASGHLPDSLSQLVPQFLQSVPQDPFDGAPPRYRGLLKGYVVYSVGRDCHDDGGRERPERLPPGDTSTYDITFTVER